MKKWIGLDPSIAAFGYAVLQRHDHSARPTVMALGVMTTKQEAKAQATDDRARRIVELAGDLTGLFDEHPDAEAVWVESLALGMPTGRLTAQVLGRVRGLVEGLCFARKLPVFEVSPTVLKAAVAGSPGAKKEEVARVVRAYYGVQATSLDATDALAVAHVGAFRSGGGVVIQSGTVRYTARTDDEG